MRKTYIIHADYNSTVWNKLVGFFGLNDQICISIYDKDKLKSIQVEFTEVYHIGSGGVKWL